MTRVALTTVGCRLNQYETDRMAADLIRAGMERVGYQEKANLYIINSCTVTGRADADCRNLIRRANRKNREAVIVVTGCYVVSSKDEISAIEGVDITIGNDEKNKLAEILEKKFPDLFHVIGGENEGFAKTGTVESRNRSVVKVGDGCNQNCAYCIVPSVRGRLKSVSSTEIINEIERKVASGFHEVVLTAVHIGKYNDGEHDLGHLVHLILDQTDLSRLRLSSLEPNELDDSLLGLVSGNPRVCRHLHLPLQSGSDRILKMMNRPYTSQRYKEIIQQIKAANPDITIGCDLIVGFPGETDYDFEKSLEILNTGHIDYSHVFSYSDRIGTAAHRMSEKIAPQIMKSRSRIVREIGIRRKSEKMRRQLNCEFGVISENRDNQDNFFWGISDNFLKVKMPEGIGGGRKIVTVIPTSLEKTATGDPYLICKSA